MQESGGLAVEHSDPLDILPADLANLGQVVDLAQRRCEPGAREPNRDGARARQRRVRNRDEVDPSVPDPVADVAGVAPNAGDDPVLVLFDAGLFAHLAHGADDIGLARAQPPPLRDLPHEDAAAPRVEHERPQSGAAVIPHER